MKKPLLFCLALLFGISLKAQECFVEIFETSDPSTSTYTLVAELYSVTLPPVGPETYFTWTDGTGSIIGEGQVITLTSTPGSTFVNPICVFGEAPDLDCYAEACIELDGLGSGGGGGMDCAANFDYTFSSVSNEIYFVADQGSFFDPIVSYSWEFSDGWLAGSDSEVTYTIGFAPLETVCLTITTASGCTDTICYDIDGTGSGGGGDECSALFTYTFAGSTNEVFFAADPGSFADPITDYEWSFSDGWDVGNEPEVTYFLGFAPLEWACLTITTESGCTDTFCEEFGGSGEECYAEFTYEDAGEGVYIFYGTGGGSAVDPGEVISYQWSFGSGDYGEGQVYTQVFDEVGSYEVCLTITTEDGCTAASCYDITVVETGGSDTYSICGSVTTGDPSLDIDLSCEVYLFSLSADGSFVLVDVQSTSASAITLNNYCFDALNEGDYVIQAVVNASSSLYPYYMPTYYGDDLFWADADIITLEDDFSNATIDLIDIADFPGHGNDNQIDIYRSDNISGHVYDLEGEPLQGVLVMLLNMSDVPLGYQYTDETGFYAFADVPFGDYQVYVEAIGMITEAADITLDEENPSIPNIDFLMGDGNVVLSAIKEVILLNSEIALYPNPVKQEAFISIYSLETTDIAIEILDVQGRSLYNAAQMVYQGEQVIQLPTHMLSNGLYMAHLLTKNGQQIAIPFIK